MSFVVSAGALTDLQRAAAPTGMTVALAEGVTHDYAAIWRTQPQVRTVVSFLARNIAQIGLHVYERVSDTDRKRLSTHPLAVLLAKPNLRTTRYRLIDSLVQDLGIYDNALWLKLDGDSGQPRGLLRLPPQYVTPLGESWLMADGYRLKGTKGSKDFPAEQVVHFRGHNPADPRWGVSPIETLRRVLAEEYAAGQYREQLWRNGARMSGYLSRPPAAPQWSDAARSRFRQSWRSQYTGAGVEAGGTPILEDGMEFKSAAVSPVDAQYLEARKLTREEVASAYHIPLPMVGILDHATFSNITEQHKQLYQDTLGPWLEMLQEDIELQLLPDLDTTGRVYVEFNLAEKLKGSFEDQATQLQTAVGAPWLTRNEARARQNLPQIVGGDDLVTPMNVLVGGQASPTDSAPKQRGPRGRRAKARAGQEVEDVALERLQEFFRRQGAAVLSALGAGKTLAQAWDDDRWAKELSDDLFQVAGLTAAAAAGLVLDRLGLPADYDAERTLAWLRAHADGTAAVVNATTRGQLVDAGDVEDTDDEPTAAAEARTSVFTVAAATRAAALAAAEVSAVSGFGAVEAVKQQGLPATKTWRAGPQPRATHAALDGETVLVDEAFSNGARWPGDSSLSNDERAGCNCSMDIDYDKDS